MTLNGEFDVRMRLQEVAIRIQSLLGIGPDVRLVKIKVRVLHGRIELLFQGLRRRRRWWRRRWSRYCHAGRAGIRATRTGDCTRISGGVRRRHRGGAGGLLFADSGLEV